MTTPVTIENDALEIEVWPSFGGKVASVVDKADGYDLLFNYPAELPTRPLYDVPYAKSWYAGWDECFPSEAPCKYHGHPYDGIAIPDHGELWGIPTTAVPTKNGITTVWQGLRFGYRLTRKLYLDGPSLKAEYTLVNLAPFDLRFVWSPHALLSMEAPVELTLEGSPAFRWSHDGNGNDVQRTFEWPMLQDTGDDDAPLADLSRPAKLPPRKAWKVFSTGPAARAAHVLYPSRGRSLRIEFTSADLAAYWSIWINTGGWAGHRHAALAPTTGRFDQLDRAVRDGSAGKAPPAGRCDWSMTWSVA
jgi:hypothetical protein